MSKRKSLQLTEHAIPIIVFHGLATLAFIPSFITWSNAVLLLVGVLVFGQGINLGYHRLLTHRSLQVPRWLEYWYVFLALSCMEETPAKWVSTHRRHHSESDSDESDPHSPNRSIFWSHMGWLLFRRDGKSSLNVDRRFAADILDDPVYMYLEKNSWLTFVLIIGQFASVLAIGTLVFAYRGSQLPVALWAGFGVALWLVVLRVTVVWHITWSVNSLSHVMGYQTYKTSDQSRNNWFVALIASGEGWHNNHHHDQASASVQHKWWEFDLTYYHIRLLELLGLATKVVRPRHTRRLLNRPLENDSSTAIPNK